MKLRTIKESPIQTRMKRQRMLRILGSVVTSLLTMAAFTVVCFAAEDGGTTPPTGGGGTADEAYQSTINFFITWIKRIGLMVAFVGAIMFGFASRNEDADAKTRGLLTLVSGLIVAALCQGVDMFHLFE
jgi:hypothetical protein